MGVYIFALCILILGTIIQLLKPRNRKSLKFLYFISAFSLILIAGLRYGLETDYWHYYYIFTGELKVGTQEPAFSLLIWLVRLITSNYNIFLLIVALISLGIKCKIFSEYKYYFLILLLYFLRFYVLLELNAIRQGISTAFVLLAVIYFLKADNKRFVIYTIIGTMFHASAILLLIAIPFKKVKLNLKNMTLICVIAVLFRVFFLERLIQLAASYIPFVLTSTNNLINGTKYIINHNQVDDFSVITLLRIIASLYAMFLLHGTNKGDDKYNSLLNMYFLGSIINIVFMGYDTISYRLAVVFFCVEGILLNYALENKRINLIGRVNIRVLTCLPVIVFCDAWSFIATVSSSGSLVPYQIFFGK